MLETGCGGFMIFKNRSGITDSLWFDSILLLVLLLLSVYAVYFASSTTSKIFFLLLLVWFMFSKKDYFWFAFFFIIIAGPGWLFTDFSSLSLKRLPLYTFLAGMSFTPLDLFLIVALAKSLFFGKIVKIQLAKPMIYILLYGIMLMFLSFFVYGASSENFLYLFRSTFVYTVVISFSFLVHKTEGVDRFMYLIFPMVFFIFFTQLYYLVSGGNDFVNSLSPDFRYTALTEAGALRSTVGGITLVMFSYVFSLFKLQYAKNEVKKFYLWVIAVVCFLSVLISGTRAYIIMFSFMLLCYIVFLRKRVRRFVQLAAIVFVVIIVAINVSPLRSGINNALTRVDQLSAIAKGQYYRAPTFERRFGERLPRLMVGLKQNWTLGWGYSDMYLAFSDGHVGNFNLLLQVGIVGFGLFCYFWVRYFGMIFGARRRVNSSNVFKDSLLILVFAFAAMLVAHFSTYYMFGLTGMESGIFFVSIYIAISESIVRDSNNRVLSHGVR
jgi:hypothetical protein